MINLEIYTFKKIIYLELQCTKEQKKINTTFLCYKIAILTPEIVIYWKQNNPQAWWNCTTQHNWTMHNTFLPAWPTGWCRSIYMCYSLDSQNWVDRKDPHCVVVMGSTGLACFWHVPLPIVIPNYSIVLNWTQIGTHHMPFQICPDMSLSHTHSPSRSLILSLP